MKKTINPGIAMYFNPAISAKFAEQEQNEKNFRTANIIDTIVMYRIKTLMPPLHIAELGGGAHPDRYHNLFKYLIKTKSKIDWVDISPIMLKLAKKYISKEEYKSRLNIINFIEGDILIYLEKLTDNFIDIAIMKYTFDHIKDIEKLFSLLSKKLKNNGFFIATMTTLKPEIRSVSTNSRYLYRGEEFPDNETRKLEEGEAFGIRHLKVSGHPELGTIPGAEVIKYYHTPEKIKSLAKKYNFRIFLGDWKEYLPKEKQTETMNQDVLILEKQ